MRSCSLLTSITWTYLNLQWSKFQKKKKEKTHRSQNDSSPSLAKFYLRTEKCEVINSVFTDYQSSPVPLTAQMLFFVKTDDPLFTFANVCAVSQLLIQLTETKGNKLCPLLPTSPTIAVMEHQMP